MAAAQELRSAGMASAWQATYDPFRQRVALIGDGSYSYEWDGIAWRRGAELGAPGVGFAFVDRASGDLRVLQDNGQEFRLWTRRHGAWQPSVSAAGAVPRDLVSLVHDTVNNQLVLFGGRQNQSQLLDETWVWTSSAGWLQRQPAVRPPARETALMAFDSARQRVVMFGGVGAGFLLDDTWEWDGNNWLPVVTAARPVVFGGSLVFDSVRSRCVLLGLGLASQLEHWEYDGTSWLQLPAPPVPLASARGLTAVFDAARSEVLVAAFRDANWRLLGGWAWNGTTWSPRPGIGDGAPSVSGAAFPNGIGNNILLRFGGLPFAGSSESDELWVYDGANWSLVSAGTIPARSHAAMWTQQGNLYVHGGRRQGVELGDTWRFDGVSWTQVNSLLAPPPVSGHAIAYDLVADRAVHIAWPTTWTFDGSQWQAIATATTPSFRVDYALAYDLVRNRTVLGAGYTSSGALEDTWEFDGSVWQQTTTVGAPQRIAFDLQGQRLVGASRTNLGGAVLMTYTGSSWLPLPAVGDQNLSPSLGFSELSMVPGVGGRVTLLNSGMGLVAELIPTPARVSSYGSGCNGGLQLAANSLPQLGNAGFGLELVGIGPNAPAAIVGAAQPASVPLFGCTLLVAPGVATALVTSSATGLASVPLSVPNTASLLGADFYFQGAALQPTSANGFQLSAGLSIVLGL
jgi:hypothetical protein